MHAQDRAKDALYTVKLALEKLLQQYEIHFLSARWAWPSPGLWVEEICATVLPERCGGRYRMLTHHGSSWLLNCLWLSCCSSACRGTSWGGSGIWSICCDQLCWERNSEEVWWAPGSHLRALVRGAGHYSGSAAVSPALCLQPPPMWAQTRHRPFVLVPCLFWEVELSPMTEITNIQSLHSAQVLHTSNSKNEITCSILRMQCVFYLFIYF